MQEYFKSSAPKTKALGFIFMVVLCYQLASEPVALPSVPALAGSGTGGGDRSTCQAGAAAVTRLLLSPHSAAVTFALCCTTTNLNTGREFLRRNLQLETKLWKRDWMKRLILLRTGK